MKCFVSCVTYDPKFLPTMQCQVGLYLQCEWEGKWKAVSERLLLSTSRTAVACWYSLFVKLLFDERGDILLDVVLLKSLAGAVDGILLHIL